MFQNKKKAISEYPSIQNLPIDGLTTASGNLPPKDLTKSSHTALVKVQVLPQGPTILQKPMQLEKKQHKNGRIKNVKLISRIVLK